jgi:hypothetical protein
MIPDAEDEGERFLLEILAPGDDGDNDLEFFRFARSEFFILALIPSFSMHPFTSI